MFNPASVFVMTVPGQLMGAWLLLHTGMQEDAASSDGDDAAEAGPADHPMEDDSLQCFEGHGGQFCCSGHCLQLLVAGQHCPNVQHLEAAPNTLSSVLCSRSCARPATCGRQQQQCHQLPHECCNKRCRYVFLFSTPPLLHRRCCVGCCLEPCSV